MRILISRSIILATLLIISVFCASCATVPLTGRRQISLIPSETMLSMSYARYREFIDENKLSDDAAQVKRVKSIGQRIQGAVEQYMADSGLGHRLENYRWEFNLIENEQANAWCMPGGKVVVYTGILPITQDDNGLAVVMAHEIAHVVAEHGNERMSQGLIASLGGLAISAALQSKPEQTKQLWMGVYGAGADYGILMPYSRIQENEADHLGLIFMAMAGHDPNAAVAFWKRISESKEAKRIPEYLSTHPSDKTRIENIERRIPEAMRYYRQGD